MSISCFTQLLTRLGVTQLVYQLAHPYIPVFRYSNHECLSKRHLSHGSRRLIWPVHEYHYRTAADRPIVSAGATAVWVAVDGQVAGLAVVSDRHRPGAAAVLAELREMK